MSALLGNILKSSTAALMTSLALNYRLDENEFVLIATLAFFVAYISEFARSLIDEAKMLDDERFFFTELLYPTIVAVEIFWKSLSDRDRFFLNVAAALFVTLEGSVRVAVTGIVGAAAFDFLCAALAVTLALPLFPSWNGATSAAVAVTCTVSARFVFSDPVNIAHLIVFTAAVFRDFFLLPKQ